MKILVTGTRGIPDIPGGVESHCESLYPRLVERGVEVTIARRRPYVSSKKQKEYKGVRLFDVYAPKNRSLETIMHTLLVVIKGRVKGFRYIHIHAIGPSIAVPLARLLGMKTIVTHHGPDYERLKWGAFAKFMLRVGEWCAAKFSNEIIVISKTINASIINKYNRKNARLIYNAVDPASLATASDYILGLGLVKQKYIIAVGRFVPEKGWHDLLAALPMIDKNYKLVFVGDADHPSSYSMKLKEEAEKQGVVLTGYIKGEKLHQIYSHAALFVLPSYHEGLPIALLEAMSYNLNVVVSDIPANAEVDLPLNNYFEVKNVSQLAERINENLHSDSSIGFLALLEERYNWDDIAERTYQVYKRLMNINVKDRQSTART